MRTFSISTLGCKVNQYESRQIQELLERFGLQAAAPPSKPDLIIIHTCCVTLTASAKSRQRIRQAQNQHPDALVVVSGCLPIVHTSESSFSTKNTYMIGDRSGLASTLRDLVCDPAALPDHTPTSQSIRPCPNTSIKTKNDFKIKYKNDLSHNDLELPSLTSFKGQTRAFLKIQDGCDGACTYCIVPKTRPFVRSKPVEEILLEAQALVDSGHKEIVLTGVFLGAYGRDSVRRKRWLSQRNNHLADLLDKLAQIPKLSRIRLSSLEPGDVTDRLLNTICANRNIMPHLHLSLQSGSNAILRKMCRQYRIEEFRRTVEAIKCKIDRPAITTDIIVGFPGETDSDFEQTVDVAREVGFAKIHVFRFSPRPGTAAARSNNRVDRKVIRKRSEVLHEVSLDLGRKFRQQFLGETAEILVESVDRDPGFGTRRATVVGGRSERYFKVFFEIADKKLKKNDLVRIKLIENHENDMVGDILDVKG